MPPAPRRYHLLVNPHGGGGRGRHAARVCGERIEAAGRACVVHESAGAGDLRRLARDLSLEEDDALVVVGGDGSMHEVVNGLFARGGAPPPVGLVPAGTGNSLMLDLECTSVEAATERLLSGDERAIDVARVRHGTEVTYSFNIVGWGLAASTGRIAERLRGLGRRRYDIAGALAVVFGAPRSAVVQVDDGPKHEGPHWLVLATNTRFTGTGMRIAPQARLDDGAFDLLTVRAAGRLGLLRLLSGMGRGRHLDSPHVEMRRCRRLSVWSEPGVLNMDGELAGAAPFELEVLPRALRLRV